MLPFCFRQSQASGLGGNYHHELRPMLKSWVMNWLDIVLIGFVVIGALRGYRIGLLGAVINVAMLIFGWVIASQASYAVASLMGYYGSSGRVAVLAIYAVIMVVVVLIAQIVLKAVKSALGIATFGVSSSIDRVGGLILGTVLGVGVAGIALLLLSILVYDTSAVMISRNVSYTLETGLVESAIVPMFIYAFEALPLSGFGIINPDLAESLAILESRL